MIAVITFYTPEYEQESILWQKSCSEYLKDIPFKAYPKPSKKSWVHNCTMKAEVILNALDEFNCGIVWTDADARFKNYPEDFNKLQSYDFGCYWIPNVWNQPRNAHLKPWTRGDEALAGGTLYFNNTSISRFMIHAWQKQCEQNPTVWEQQSLQKVWDIYDVQGLKTYNFNQSYCKVFDCKWFEEEKQIIIEHTQASRRLKGTIK